MSRRPLNVGILANGFADPYSLKIAHAAGQELARGGSHCIFFGAGFPQAPLFRNEADACALPVTMDAWLLLGEMLRDSLGDVTHAVRSVPRAVTIGFDLPTLPSVGSDAETGIFQAVMHLAKRHERRRIAFIAGPESSSDARQRLGAYRMAMESVGLSADPALIVSGDFEARSGREAIRQLQRQRRFDAIVAANDMMALGALDGLKAVGIRVPQEVSVVGYDDTDESAFASPGLTTVRQPLVDIGSAAARFALEGPNPDGTESEPIVVPSPLVIRESCGCQSGDERRTLPPGVDVTRSQELREEALRELVRRELANARAHRELERLAENIVRSSDFQALARVMSGVLELLGLKRMLLCSYAGGLRHARVALESSGRDVVFHHQSQPFPVEELFPRGFLRNDKPAQIAVEPLEFADEHFGYLVLEGDLRQGLAYLTLRRYLGCTVARMAHGRELRRLYAAEKRRTEGER
ncbi:MAG TPA: substrate-binding domain-containing protein [Polyangiaceae bacterium]|nr:substrate-binding domain-containing protein [Polyangiaceae bacterium]